MTSASRTARISSRRARVGDHSSATPDCRRPEQLTVLEPGATIAERWELPFDMSRTLREVGSAAGMVSLEAVEARDPNEMEFLDIVYFSDEEAVREGRAARAELALSEVLERAPTDPVRGRAAESCSTGCSTTTR